MPDVVALARLGGRVVREASRAALAPTSGLPRRVQEYDAAALTRLLGRRVDAVTVLAGSSGTTDRARLGLRGRAVPPSVFVKATAGEAGTRVFGGLARLGAVEVGFYRDLRPGLPVEAPALVAARQEGRTGRFAVVLEDLAARGARFVDTRTPLTPDRVAAVLRELALLHGRTHGRRTPRWLGTNAGDAFLPLVDATLGRLQQRVLRHDPTLTSAAAEPLLRGYGHWARLLDDGPPSVLHGDPHPGNVYLLDGAAGGERAGLLDWQAVRRGVGLRDASYHLVLALEPDVRRAVERDLLDDYRTALRSAGGPDLSAAETWAGYRRQVAYAYVSTVFTVGLGGLQGADVAAVGLRRALAAVEDLDTAEALRHP
ncbi:phosphotransferase [Nocardioides lianchengensis]|uniref:Phosphotransferase enzyme family protein n=1 Tax=Nocardioides lianchengensis TaxID=1045774 RepID=A0A1G6RNH7_9ACTN|nr:phosphotransferase [Nocardioides lianchengensis]NYG10191.1 hypothetical protein [Nocardioides lianchengensis]SDD05496.1 Phosphotransferase enzyme family protein [Nocardioides lianchengensis]